jgi:serine/threonine-protein kinase
MDPINKETKANTRGTNAPGTNAPETNAQGTTEGSFPSQRFREFVPGDYMADGRYQIVSLIGRGAMGCVYEVEQVYLKKHYALKTLLPIEASDSVQKRFQKEALAASRLDHPNLVHAVDFGVIDKTQPYLVMDLVRGTTLAEYIRANGPLSVQLSLEIFIPVCLALDYAHREGVVHRDLKPSNIILVQGLDTQATFVPKIVDFGIAKLELLEETALTKVGEVLGTPLYMSPEQCTGGKIDNRSDIYSLGCVLYESLTGSTPFTGKSSLVTMMLHQNQTAPTLREGSLGQKFPEALETIVAKMLAKDPDARYSSCMAIAQDLEYLKRGETSKIRPGTEPAKTKASTQRTSILLACAIVGAIGLGATTFFLLRAAAPEKAGPTLQSPSDKTEDIVFPTVRRPNVEEGSFCHEEEAGRRLYSFPNTDSVGQLFFWDPEKNTLEKRLALGVVDTPDPCCLASVTTLSTES